MNTGLRGKLLGILLIPVILMVAGLGFYNYYSAKTALDHQITRTLTFINGDYVDQINGNLVDKEAVAGRLHGCQADKHGRTGDNAEGVQSVERRGTKRICRS